MREVVVKTPRKLLGSNATMIGLPLIVIMVFCSAYLGLKMQTSKSSRYTSSVTSNHANNPLLPTLPVQQADLFASVSPMLIISPLPEGVVTTDDDVQSKDITGADTGLTNVVAPSIKPTNLTKTDKSKDHKKTDNKNSQSD